MSILQNQITGSRPVLSGGFWMIGDNPGLGECVDHHIFQDDDGSWHLWGCIRSTAIGRMLYHWQSDSLTGEHWIKTGDMIRMSRNAGESIDDWYGQEWIQSPFFIRDMDKFYMFYGGHSTGIYLEGTPLMEDGTRMVECQICMMVSQDGKEWTRYKNDEGLSRIFVGPGEARDPCVVKINDIWHTYYTGHELLNGKVTPGFYVRRSSNLINWSVPMLVHRDLSPLFGSGLWNTECPHVVERNGFYYLFRTENYPLARTHVFRSIDPCDFGIDGASEKYIGSVAVAAPEIITDREGQEYITSCHDLRGGIRICRLKWVED